MPARLISTAPKILHEHDPFDSNVIRFTRMQLLHFCRIVAVQPCNSV
jgi:hypothetical protein